LVWTDSTNPESFSKIQYRLLQLFVSNLSRRLSVGINKGDAIAVFLSSSLPDVRNCPPLRGAGRYTIVDVFEKRSAFPFSLKILTRFNCSTRRKILKTTIHSGDFP
jgi:hypothetical protein